MKGFFFLLGTFLLVSCAALPAIHEPSSERAGKSITCPSPFLLEKNRFIHAIEVHMGGKPKTSLIGVTLVDPVSRTFSCAIMSTEGMVLFEASSGPDGVKVIRALPPFDTTAFVSDLMDDMELIFLAPAGVLTRKGVFAEGEIVCRWHKEQGGWVDVLAYRDGRIQIRRYSEFGALQRTVKLDGNAKNAHASIELQAIEFMNYTLIMTLIESEAVKDVSPMKK